MVLVLSQSSSESQLQQKQEEETKASISRTRQAAEALSSRKDSECASKIILGERGAASWVEGIFMGESLPMKVPSTSLL